MLKTNYKNRVHSFSCWRWMICFMFLVGMWTTSAQAQTTITTTFANNNGSSVVVFSVQNNNPYAIIMTDIGSHAGVTSTYTCYLYAKAATYNVAPGAAGAITAANGWSVVASNSSLSLPANTSGTGSTASPFITGMSYTIPAMTQVRLALQLATGAGLPPFTTTAGSLRYSTVSGTCSFTGAGVDLNSCASYGYGGTLSSPTNTPRGLVGYISFIPAVPCTGTPTPGNTTANVNPVCPSSSFTLGLQNPSNGSGVTYQWQSSPDNITYTNISGATSASYALTQSVDTWYQCIVTCTNSGQTTTSNPLQVTTNPFYNCYCTSTATSTADEDILNVTFGSLNNTSTCSTTGTGPGSVLNMYSNYRSGVGAPAAPSVMQGDVVPLSLGLGTCGGSYPNTAKVFIDWNQNGLFTDAGEEVYVSTSGSGARTVTGSVTVPLSAVPGNTAMRVVFVETSTPVPCGTYTWGETEDYLINVVATSACSGAPVAGTASGPASICPSIAFTVSTSGATVGTGISGQWYSSTDGGSTWSPISGATSTSYNVAAGISVPTMYQYVITCSNSGLSATSNNISIAVNPVNACYCTPTSTSATYGITNLTTTGGIANINNTSPGGQGYVDNTAQAVSQLQGSSVNFSYTVVPTEGVGIWIDWNQNGSFLDAGEQVYSSGGSYVSSGSGTISVSLSQPAGNYRMRIVGNWLSTSPTPCGDLGSAGYGEAEDYTFTVIPLSNCSGTPAPGNTLSNPATACIGQNINLSLQNSVVGAGITFDWQSSPDGVTWTSTGGTLPSYTTTQSAATWYQCIVTCTNSGQSATSTPVQVTMSPFYNCYCTTGLGGSCAINSLSSVAIATTTLNNVTGGCTGTYNSFPASGSTTASLVPGVPYTMTAGCISGSNTQVAIWIDYNQNGIFETTEYTLINGNIPSGGSGSGTFTIPITALSGNTGMRVRSDWQGTTAWTSADACTNRTWGETEDYTITILIPNSCSGTPSSSVTTASVASVCPGGNVSLGTNPFYTDGGLTFDWQSSPDGITYTSTGITSQTYNVTGFSATTWYQCVVTCTNGGLSTTSTPVQVSLNPFYNCYCTTSLHSSSTPCINEIDLNTLSNNTAAAGCALPAYSFQSATTNVLKGSTYTFTRVASGTGAWTGLWIDYDHSGTFDASEYTQVSSTSTGALSNSISLLIPVTALDGNTGMRIRQRTVNMTASDACTQNFGSGETEDYTINIQTPAACTGTPAAGNTLSSAPSVCTGVSFNLTLSTTYALAGITYQWQSSTDGITYTNTSGTLPTYSTTQSAATWYQCIVTCTNSGLSITTTPVQVLQNLPNNCYCTPTSTSATYGITNFTTTGGVTNINNTSTGGQGYVNNTAQVVSQLQGSSVNFSYTVVPTEGVGIWIDWNQNGSFLDAGEQVYNAGSYVSSGSGTISVLLSQPAGNYRMRIVGNWLSTSPTPCGDLGSAGYGEAEDYTINVIPLTNCTGTPSPGNTLSDQASVCSGQNFTLSLQNNVVATGITFDWQSSPDGVTWTSTGGTLPSYTTTQSATTWYQCIVTCTLSGQSATSTPVQVTMNPIASCYCVAGATTAGCSSGDEYIGNVTLNTINNTSTCQPSGTQYTDFTAISTNLIIGDTYVASVLTPNYFGGDQAAIWIDFNQNGTFEVPAEQFILSGGASGVPFTGNITIPGSALTGNTRMRVRMAYTGTLAPCGIVTYGEVEDYTVNISPSTCVMAPTYPADAGSGCADAVTGNIALSWPALSGATGYDVYFGTTNPPTTLVSNNQPGLTYNADVSGGAPIYFWMIVPQISGGGSSCNVWSFTLSPSPIPIANSGGDVCQGSDIFLSGDNADPGQMSGNTYSWTGPNSFTSSLQYPSISNPGSSYSGTYTVIVTNQYGCTASASTSLNVNPNPSVTIDSVVNVSCAGGSDGIIYVTASGGLAPYSFTSDFVNFNSTGVMSNLPTGASTVYIADGNACQAQVVGNLTAISTAPPSQSVVVTPTIIGMPAYACAGTTANLSIPAVAGATKYIWDGPFGTFFNGNPMNQSPYTTTTPNVQITFSSSTSSFVSIGVQAANGCGASLRKIQKVRYQISTPKEITGATTMCANTNGTYTIAPVTDATGYQWMITGNATVVPSGTSVTVFFGPSWNGGNLCVAAKTPCYTTAYKCMYISKSASALNAITGPLSSCPNEVQTFSITPCTGAASYNWTLPAGATGSSSTNSITATFGPTFTQGGNICVSVTSICGVTSAPKCRTVAQGLPSVPTSISGITNGLCNQSVNYTVPSSPGVTYNWTAPGTISGNGNSSVNVTYGAFTTGQLCVTASNSCGTSASRCIPLKGSPNSPIGLTAIPASWCANTQGIEFTADLGNTTGSYTLSWGYPSSPTATYVAGGGNSNALTLDWGTGNGSVVVNASNGCGTGSKAFAVTIGCKEGEVASANKLNVYPNPTAGVLNVEYTAEKGTAQVTVLDLSGRVVMTQTHANAAGQNTLQLDLSKVAKGAYMLNVQTNGSNNQVRVVVE